MPRACSIARALDILGEKWSLLVIRELLLGCHRFNEIQANTGAPRDILSDRLRTLVEHGVVERVPYQQHPPRDEYHLTESGTALFGAITLLREWGDTYCGDPPIQFTHKCGHELETRLICAHCEQPVTNRNVRRILPGAPPGSPAR